MSLEELFDNIASELALLRIVTRAGMPRKSMSAERSMLEISVLEAALEILREIKEFDGDEQAAYALVTGFQNA